MVAEVTVTVKNEEKTLKMNHLIYEEFTASEDDPIIQNLIRETHKQFSINGEDSTDIKVRINIQVR